MADDDFAPTRPVAVGDEEERAALCRCGHSRGNHRWFAVGGRRPCCAVVDDTCCECKAFVPASIAVAVGDRILVPMTVKVANIPHRPGAIVAWLDRSDYPYESAMSGILLPGEYEIAPKGDVT